MGDKVLIVGSGGREHALACKLSQSPHVSAVYADASWADITPKCVRVNLPTNKARLSFADDYKIDLTVVGPEQPLVEGIADLFLEKGLRLFGPTRRAARLESSKAFAKEFMDAYGVPTAPFRTFRNYRMAQGYLEGEWQGPVYVKASGLAGGKGALPGRTQHEALDAVRRIMLGREFGSAGDEIVIEQMLPGEEASCTALFDSEHFISAPLLFSQDHKKLLDGDEGPNTGGMGAYAPTTLITPKIQQDVYREILWQTSRGLRGERMPYTGFLYPGLMIRAGLPEVLEFNVRAGDPETQPLMMLADFDLYEAITDTIEGRHPKGKWKSGYAVCVVLASKGYPQSPEKGKLIYNLGVERDDVVAFHAGTKYENGWHTNGGRIVGVTGYGQTMREARDRAYGAIGQENAGVYFEGMQFRHDIGQRELMRAAYCD